MISDNVRQFVSEELERFCRNNGIDHRTSAPYHPATNGLAENAVGSFKKGVSKALEDPRNQDVSLKTLVSRYLFASHSSTGEPSSKVVW